MSNPIITPILPDTMPVYNLLYHANSYLQLHVTDLLSTAQPESKALLDELAHQLAAQPKSN